MIYIGIVLLLNFAISLIFPYSIARKTEEKLGVTYKFSSKDEAGKVKENIVARAILSSWANLFVFLRPVENISYHKIIHVSLLQPLRFLVNIVTLTIVCQITWTAQTQNKEGETQAKHRHNYNQEICLIVTFCIVLAAGILNLVEFRYFFMKSRNSLPTSSENFPDEEEVKIDCSTPPPHLSTPIVENLDAGQFKLTTINQSKQSVTSMKS